MRCPLLPDLSRWFDAHMTLPRLPPRSSAGGTVTVIRRKMEWTGKDAIPPDVTATLPFVV